MTLLHPENNTKICTLCSQELSPNMFCKNKANKDNLERFCRDCKSSYKKENRKKNTVYYNLECLQCGEIFNTKQSNKLYCDKSCAALYDSQKRKRERKRKHKEYLKNNPISLTSKICPKCGDEKKLSVFGMHRQTKDELRSHCKKCEKEYRIKNSTKAKIIRKMKIFDYSLVDMSSLKLCIICGEEKKLSDFYKDKMCKDGFTGRCRLCKRTRMVYLYQKNKPKILERVRVYNKKRRKDPLFRLRDAISSSHRKFMKSTKTKSTWKYVDYTPEELRNHLESLFSTGMSWDNYGFYGWHVDHIIPQSSFDYSVEEDIRECWKLENLQPLWATDNMAKGNKLDWKKESS